MLNPGLGEVSVPGSLNAFLIVMVYFLPGSMKVDDASRKIPSWLLSGYEIFAKELPVELLVSHNNFLVSSERLVPAVEQGHDVVFLSKSIEWHAPKVDGYRLIGYKPHRPGGGSYQHPYLRRLEPAIIEGQAAYRAAQQLKNEVGTLMSLLIMLVWQWTLSRSLFPNAKKLDFLNGIPILWLRC